MSKETVRGGRRLRTSCPDLDAAFHFLGRSVGEVGEVAPGSHDLFNAKIEQSVRAAHLHATAKAYTNQIIKSTSCRKTIYSSLPLLF
ncbi:uncharacterized [Tachysurus ichikawai]